MAEQPDAVHQRPAGVDDATVDAVGKIGEAFELLERARGALYEDHQRIGWVDDTLGDGLDQLRGAGHSELADELARTWLGRNVLPGMWTFEVVEAFDRAYYDVAVESERRVREALMEGRRHVQEAERAAGALVPGSPDVTWFAQLCGMDRDVNDDIGSVGALRHARDAGRTGTGVVRHAAGPAALLHEGPAGGVAWEARKSRCSGPSGPPAG